MKRREWCRLMVMAICLALAAANPADAQEEEEKLPPLHTQGEPYETPLAGEGCRTEVFGCEVTVEPRDRRSVNAWTLGFQVNIDEPDDRLVIPFGSVYLWRHPDEDTLFRAELAGLYNDVFYARSPAGWGPFEWVVSFRNFTLPFDRSEIVEGERLESEEMTWGFVRPGFGLGYRRQTWPGKQDNMFAVDFLIEPSYNYFDKGKDAAAAFVAPQDTSEVRGKLRLRWDSLLRNILSLPHKGFALGGEAVYGYRFEWESWGIDRERPAADGRDYQVVTAYLVAAGGVPFVASERHRLLGSLYGGTGSDLDRFTAPRVSGGPKPLGEEYGSTYRPILPGAAIREFFPEDYAIFLGEYRWEPLFFTYLHLRTSVAYLDRLRRHDDTGELYHSEDYFASLGVGATTGFFWNSRLNLDYNYNTSVIRKDDYGGHAVVVRLSKRF